MPSLVAVNKSIIWRRNVRPGRTTLHAWFNNRIKDSSSLRAHTFLSPQFSMVDNSLCNFSAGSLNEPVTESISMPRKVKHVVEPSRL